jgi:hypothetical protein
MHMLQPSLAGHHYSLFGAPPAPQQGSHPGPSGWRLTVPRSGEAPSPAEEEALYWDPCG